MESSFFMNCLRYSLFVFNIFLALSGIALIVGGAVVLKDVEGITSALPSSFTAPAIIFIFCGVIVFVLAVLGCCGVLRESYILLLVFGVSLSILFIVILAIGITAAVSKDSSTENLRTDMEDEMNNYSKKKTSKKFWDKTQKSMECCGIEHPMDWKGKFIPDFTIPPNLPISLPPNAPKNFNLADFMLPRSCCYGKNATHVCYPSEGMTYQEGCLDKLHEKLNKGATIIMGIGIAVAIFLLIGIVLAFWYAIELKKEYEDDD